MQRYRICTLATLWINKYFVAKALHNAGKVWENFVGDTLRPTVLSYEWMCYFEARRLNDN